MPKSVEYYLSKGFDKAAAEYFANGTKQIVAVVPSDNYTLIISFDNGEKRLYDAKPLFTKNSVFNKISAPDDFRRVYVDSSHCIAWDIDPNIDSETVWNNKLDLCPDSCYIDSIPIT
ncbi:MAG: DUF2442 domain-containing protein [Oscillospiraceae bacterium]|nr:DUF2442 domain-containing protein [Oscillospiraceae bacterium]